MSQIRNDGHRLTVTLDDDGVVIRVRCPGPLPECWMSEWPPTPDDLARRTEDEPNCWVDVNAREIGLEMVRGRQALASVPVGWSQDGWGEDVEVYLHVGEELHHGIR